MYGCEPSFEIRQSPPCSNSRAEIFNTLVKEMCVSENEQCFKPLEKVLESFFPPHLGQRSEDNWLVGRLQKVWLQPGPEVEVAQPSSVCPRQRSLMIG